MRKHNGETQGRELGERISDEHKGENEVRE